MSTPEDYNIKVPDNHGGSFKARCPECDSIRSNKTDKSLSVKTDEDGWAALCHYCGWSVGYAGGSKVVKDELPEALSFTPESLGKQAVEFFKRRGIFGPVLNYMDISQGERIIEGKKVNAILFPFYDQDGDCRFVKCRGPQKTFSCDPGGTAILFGLDKVEPSWKQLVICEGEIDQLSLTQSGVRNAVSVPNGASDKKMPWLSFSESLIDGMEEVILATDGDKNGRKLQKEISRRVGRSRCRVVTWPEGCKDANDVLVNHGPEKLRQVIHDAEFLPIEGALKASDFAEDIYSLWKHGPSYGLKVGYPSLNDIYLVRRGELCVVTGFPNQGKALALDTVVPTPAGWTTMGDIRVGDEVFDENGNVCRVTKATDVMYDHPCYRVRFSDGCEVVADAEHQWFTWTEAARMSERNKRGWFYKTGGILGRRGRSQDSKRVRPGVVTTTQISKTLKLGGKYNHSIPYVSPVGLPEKNLPVDPYVLGAWLGDGTSSNGGFSTGDPELIAEISNRGYSVNERSAKYGFGILGLAPTLRSIGVMNRKHIPVDYLRSSVHQRLELLKGLMDTDGYIGKCGSCSFDSVNYSLACGVQELVASLGMRSHFYKGEAKLNGEVVSSKYRVSFIPTMQVFTLSRKQDRYKGSVKSKHRFIHEVEPVESVPVRCIEVDSPSHLFCVTEFFVPTHNSSFVDQVCVNMAEAYGWRFGLCSFENTREEHFRKVAQSHMRKSFDLKARNRATLHDVKGAVSWFDQHFTFIEPPSPVPTIDEVLDIARGLIMREGLDAIVIDPYNRLSSDRKENTSETEHIAQLLGKVQAFARRYQVAVWFVAHPAKMPPGRDGQRPIPSMMDISGSAHWSNMTDVGISVGRNFDEGTTEIHTKKVRNVPIAGTPGKKAVFKYDLSTCRFYENDPKERLAFSKKDGEEDEDAENWIFNVA